ncbi:hypothetical protein MMC19_006815 [Ptychographa xylographoides]|nr:hypothetical protein [Ptychographa xylographoides]
MTVLTMTSGDAPAASTNGSVYTMEHPSKPTGPGNDFEGNIKVSQSPPTKGDLAKAADIPILNAQNESMPFKKLYMPTKGGRRVLILFIRHFFCGVSASSLILLSVADVVQNCQEYLRTFCSSITAENLLGLSTPTELAIIGCGQPELIPFYAETTNCTFPIYADPTKKLYKLLGMTRTLTLGDHRPDYMQKSLMSVMLQSIYQGLTKGRQAFRGGDYWQVGGEFLFEDGEAVWCHRMQNTRDHAEVPELRKQLGLDDQRPPARKRWSTLGNSSLVRKLSLSRSRSGNRNSMTRLSTGGKDSKEGSVMEKLKEEKTNEATSEGQ